MNQLAQTVNSAVLIDPKDLTGAAHIAKAFSMKAFARARINIVIGTLTGSDTMNVTLEQGTAGAGSASACTGHKALAFDTVYVKDAATGVKTKTAVTSNTFAIANTVTAGTVYEIEVIADSLDVTNSFVVVQPKISSPGAHASLAAVTVDCYVARYSGDTTAAVDPLVD